MTSILLRAPESMDMYAATDAHIMLRTQLTIARWTKPGRPEDILNTLIDGGNVELQDLVDLVYFMMDMEFDGAFNNLEITTPLRTAIYAMLSAD